MKTSRPFLIVHSSSPPKVWRFLASSALSGRLRAWQKGNNPSAIEYEFAEMWEHHKIKHYKGLAHANPGGYTYTDGWSQLIKSAARINDEDARLREAAEIRAELKQIATQKRGGLLELDTPFRQAVAAGVGGLALLVGVGLMLRSRRKGQ